MGEYGPVRSQFYQLKGVGYDIPVYTHEDARLADELVAKLAPRIFDVYQDHLAILETIFRELSASGHSAFPEFFAWFFHLAYVEAIDYLADQKFFAVPEESFDYWKVEMR